MWLRLKLRVQFPRASEQKSGVAALKMVATPDFQLKLTHWQFLCLTGSALLYQPCHLLLHLTPSWQLNFELDQFAAERGNNHRNSPRRKRGCLTG